MCGHHVDGSGPEKVEWGRLGDPWVLALCREGSETGQLGVELTRLGQTLSVGGPGRLQSPNLSAQDF